MCFINPEVLQHLFTNIETKQVLSFEQTEKENLPQPYPD